MLVVIPFLASILGIILSDLFPLSPSQIGFSLLTPYVAGFIYLFSIIYLVSISSLVYGFYPIKFRIIEKRGFSNLLTEQAYVKNILYVEIPILIAATIIMSVFGFYPGTYLYLSLDSFLQSIATSLGLEDYTIWILTGENMVKTEWFGAFFWLYFFNGLMINLGISVTSGIIWMVLVAARKKLGYYISKSLFQTTTQEKEASKKAEYLIKATKIYDKYLRRTLNLEINDAKKVYSKILSDPNLNKDESMRLITESFESDDKLEPIKCLSKILNVKDTDTFLVDESIVKRIKDMAIFFATIIPVVVTVIQLML